MHLPRRICMCRASLLSRHLFVSSYDSDSPGFEPHVFMRQPLKNARVRLFRRELCDGVYLYTLLVCLILAWYACMQSGGCASVRLRVLWIFICVLKGIPDRNVAIQRIAHQP